MYFSDRLSIEFREGERDLGNLSCLFEKLGTLLEDLDLFLRQSFNLTTTEGDLLLLQLLDLPSFLGLLTDRDLLLCGLVDLDRCLSLLLDI